MTARARHEPVFGSSKTASEWMDMDEAQFLGLVACGALPGPIRRPGLPERWARSDIEAIMSGEAAIPEDQDIS
ncbi:MAG: hypothetical protein AAGF94_18145 [Pseudomonadota bacterium]